MTPALPSHCLLLAVPFPPSSFYLNLVFLLLSKSCLWSRERERLLKIHLSDVCRAEESERAWEHAGETPNVHKHTQATMTETHARWNFHLPLLCHFFCAVSFSLDFFQTEAAVRERGKKRLSSARCFLLLLFLSCKLNVCVCVCALLLFLNFYTPTDSLLLFQSPWLHKCTLGNFLSLCPCTCV